MRAPNTNRFGFQFDAETVEQVWQTATPVPGHDPRLLRFDSCGHVIARGAYGQFSEFGWEVDHKRPVAKGGDDAQENLQPLHWLNNRIKADDWPMWSCAIAS